jgi:A1 cistron-splicing factor AAR2
MNPQLNYENRMNSGVLLLLNCPKLMEFGIDNSSWTIGDKFMGIKHIPYGPHFIHYSTKDENYQFKQGFFINVEDNDKIHIRKWNNEVADFITLKEEEFKNFSVGINNLDFDAYLGNYPIDQISNWKDMTKFINKKVIERLEPIHKKYITNSKEYETNKNEEEIKGNIYFTNIPLKKSYLGSKLSPEELTEINLDKSAIFEELILKEYNREGSIILGEFQYAFVTFLLCEIYESFEQWRKIFILICSCKKNVMHRESFYCDFIEVIYHIFRNFPKDFFTDQITCDSFINKLLNDFIYTCEVSLDVNSSLITRIKFFKKFLNEYFDFEIKNEEERIIDKYLNNVLNDNSDMYDDDMPVIVREIEIKRSYDEMGEDKKDSYETEEKDNENLNVYFI